MTLIEKQTQLEAQLQKARNEHEQSFRRVQTARKALDAFQKQHGNPILANKNRQAWLDKEPEREARRQTAEWQQWRKNFLKC